MTLFIMTFLMSHSPFIIHLDKRKMNNEEALQEFFAKYGVSKENFTDTYHSFSVDTKMGRAQNMTAQYGINGVLAVIVNGKYRY